MKNASNKNLNCQREGKSGWDLTRIIKLKEIIPLETKNNKNRISVSNIILYKNNAKFNKTWDKRGKDCCKKSILRRRSHKNLYLLSIDCMPGVPLHNLRRKNSLFHMNCGHKLESKCNEKLSSERENVNWYTVNYSKRTVQ